MDQHGSKTIKKLAKRLVSLGFHGHFTSLKAFQGLCWAGHSAPAALVGL